VRSAALTSLVLATTALVAPDGATATGPGARPAGTGAVRFGVYLSQQNVSWEQVVEAVARAEALGFDSAWVYDHFIPIWGDADGPVLEGWTLLAALAKRTSRIRLGVLVTGNTYRNPALIAKMATTVDHVSNGRVTLGMGAGWFEPEHRAFGFEFGSARERAERLAEALQVITLLWTEKRPSFEGRYYRLDRTPFEPAPVQRPHPPIIVGGQGKKWIVPLVGRHADGWNAVTGVTPEGIRERVEIIRDACAEAGRSPCPSHVSVLLPVVRLTRIPLAGSLIRLGARFVVDADQARALLVGPPAAMARDVRRYVDAGANEIIFGILPPFDPRTIERLAREVVPAVREPGGGRGGPAEEPPAEK
jgi:F420-dependent oxidoreductase-like protein